MSLRWLKSTVVLRTEAAGCRSSSVFQKYRVSTSSLRKKPCRYHVASHTDRWCPPLTSVTGQWSDVTRGSSTRNGTHSHHSWLIVWWIHLSITVINHGDPRRYVSSTLQVVLNVETGQYITSCHIIIISIVDLKRQNRLKVGTDNSDVSPCPCPQGLLKPVLLSLFAKQNNFFFFFFF